MPVRWPLLFPLLGRRAFLKSHSIALACFLAPATSCASVPHPYQPPELARELGSQVNAALPLSLPPFLNAASTSPLKDPLIPA